MEFRNGLKKGVCIALAAGMAVSVAGCKKAEEKSDNGATVVEWYYPGAEQPDLRLVEDEINKIATAEKNVAVKFMPVDSGAYDEKMNLMMASGTPFDICFTGYINTYSRGVSMNGFLKLNDYIDARPALKEAVPQYAWDVVNVGNGDIYAVPNIQLYALPQMVYTDKKYADKYNIDFSAMKTINEIEPYLEILKNNEPMVYPYDPANKGVYPWARLNTEELITGVEALVINRDDQKAEIYKLYDTPEFYEGVKTLHEWFKKGYIRSDIASAEGQSQSSKEEAVSIQAYKPGVVQDVKLSSDKDMVYFVLDEPYLNTSVATQTLNAVSATSKNPEAAMDFLELVYTNKELYRLIIHGIEGVHYEMIDDVHFKPLNTDRYNNHHRGWMFGNQFDALLADGKEADVWAKSEEMNRESKKSPILGLMLSTENVLNEIANVTAIEEEYSGLFNGSLGPEKIEEMKSRLEAAGIDNIIKDFQKQIDDFLAEKK